MNCLDPPYVVGQFIRLADGTQGMVSAVSAKGVWIWVGPGPAGFLPFRLLRCDDLPWWTCNV